MSRDNRKNEKPVTEALRELRERADLSMAQLAKALGYKGPSSYQRYEDANLYKREFLPPELQLRLGEILPGRGSPPITFEEVSALGAFPLSRREPGEVEQPPEFTEIPILDEVGAGIWREGGGDLKSVIGWIPITPTNLLPPPFSEYALLVKGTSANRVAQEGDYLICMDFTEKWEGGPMHPTEPELGDLIVVERTRDDGSLRELSVRRLTREFDGTRVLALESDDPRHQHTLNVKEADNRDIPFRMKGLVLMRLGILHHYIKVDFQST